MIIKGEELKNFDWKAAATSNYQHVVVFESSWPDGSYRSDCGVLLDYFEQHQLINVGQLHTRVPLSKVISVKITKDTWI